MKLRNPRGLDPTLTDAIRSALRDGRDVELANGQYGLAIEIDGETFVDGLAWETFDYPLHNGNWNDEQRELIDELLRLREKRRAERSKEKAGDTEHIHAEGYDG